MRIFSTCNSPNLLIGFNSGEYAGNSINSMQLRISAYSGLFSSQTNRFVFLCQGALSIIKAYFYLEELDLQLKTNE